MATRTYKIEVKANVNTEQHDALLMLTKQLARNMLASALMVAPNGAIISASTEDAFYDQAEIELLDPEDG